MNGLMIVLLAVSLACVYGTSIDVAKCGFVCMMYCPYGNVLDDNGCPLCKCMQEATLSPKNPCPVMTCDQYCANGYFTDSDGCQTCMCNYLAQTVAPS